MLTEKQTIVTAWQLHLAITIVCLYWSSARRHTIYHILVGRHKGAMLIEKQQRHPLHLHEHIWVACVLRIGEGKGQGYVVQRNRKVG